MGKQGKARMKTSSKAWRLTGFSLELSSGWIHADLRIKNKD